MSFTLLFAGTLAANQTSAQSDMTPLKADAWDVAKARHLLSRAGFGGTPEQIRKLHARGLQGAIDYLVDFENQAKLEINIAVEIPKPKQIDRAELAKLSVAERKKKIELLRRDNNNELRRRDRQQLSQIRQIWIQRMIQSQRPLEEKLVLFWHGHFASGYQTVRSSYAMHQQNELFREHALSFNQLLEQIIHDPAMLRYLDNDRNVKSHPNENLAREILELFSMGEGSYSEKDIKEAARALTGYTFDRKTMKPVFRSKVHDNGSKTIFGQKGDWDGDDLVELILQQPATAKFIAKKVFVFFSHDQPSKQTIDELAQILRTNDYKLRPLLKALFRSKEFYSERSVGTQIKSPVQLSIGIYKNLGIQNFNSTAIFNACRSMGQELLQPPNVKGWDGGRTWINTNSVFLRNSSAAGLITGQGIPKRPTKAKGNAKGGMIRGVNLVGMIETRNPESSAEIVEFLSSACLAVPLSDKSQQQLVEFIDSGRPLPPANKWSSQRQQVNSKLQALLVLITGLPEFQLT